MNLERMIALRAAGLGTEGIGPEAECDPVPWAEHQERHNQYWWVLGDLLADGYGDDPDADDDDLPWWMSQAVSERLRNND